MVGITQELVVRGEQVERIFINYVERKYIVNRRYQRKLIWTIEEKQSFIDSIINGFPVPIILLAEPANRTNGAFEIIDGMQRMNAITSFIANDFPVRDCYFDLNTFATTKDLLDRGIIEQREPRLSREFCLAISAYPVPLSIYEFAEGESVDEVFRRINSGGKQLSRQELRAAGATNSFADCVRLISSKIRGDSSSTNIVLLNDMKEISITNKELPYGIVADDVFWVKNGILTKDQLRQSRDEELIADLISYMVSEDPVPSRTELLDDYFGATVPLDGANLDRFNGMDQAIRRRNPDLVELDYQRVHDELVLVIGQAGTAFSELLFPKNPSAPVPRYFQAVFLALHQLIVKGQKAVADRGGLIDRLRDSGKQITIQEGGRWGADNRSAAVNSVVGMLQAYFEDDRNPDPATVHWVTKLQNLLTNSKTEQAAYDFKQGFLTLSEPPAFDEPSFQNILRTRAAIANIAKGHKGYVVVGVAETEATALRVEKLFGASPLPYSGFYVTGVEHEAAHVNKSLDDYFHLITNKISASDLSDPLKSYVNGHLKCVRYYDKVVFVFEVIGQDQPSTFNNQFFERRGTQVIQLTPPEYASLFARFRA